MTEVLFLMLAAVALVVTAGAVTMLRDRTRTVLGGALLLVVIASAIAGYGYAVFTAEPYPPTSEDCIGPPSQAC